MLDVTCLTARVDLALHGLRVWVEKRGPMANSGARRCLTVAVKQAGRRSNGGTETVEVSSRGAERNGIAGGTLGHGRCKTPRRVSNHGARWNRCRAGTSERLGRLEEVPTPGRHQRRLYGGFRVGLETGLGLVSRFRRH